MKTHYYLGWFNNFFPEKLGKVLQKDISNRNDPESSLRTRENYEFALQFFISVGLVECAERCENVLNTIKEI